MNNEDRRELLNEFLILAIEVKIELETLDDLTESEEDIICTIDALQENFSNLACEEFE